MKSKPRNSKGSKKSGRNNPAIDNPIKPIHSKLQDNAHPDPTAISRDRVMQYETLMPHEVPSPLPNQTTNGIEYPRFDRRPPTTSMETEFIEALYSDLSGRTSCSPSINTNPILDSAYTVHSDLDLPPHSSSESDDIDYEDMESYDEDRGEDGDCEDFDDDLDVYEHDDFLSSQEAILMELRREQVEFEENVRQLQQQLQRQGSLLPLSSNDGDEFESIAQSNVYSDHIDATGDSNNTAHEIDGGKIEHGIGGAIGLFPGSNYVCNSCNPKSSLCLESYGSIWRIAIIEALATAAATIASFNAYQYQQDQDRNDQSSIEQTKFRYFEFLPRPRPPNRPRDTLEHQYDLKSLKSNEATDGEAVLSDRRMDPSHRTSQATSIRHMYQDMTPPSPAIRYPLPPNSPYKFGRKSSEFLEPVGEFHEFQSAEGNSRQVLLHVWPPSSQDAPLLQRLEACCRDFQENDVVRGHSGDGFLNGWRPSWKQPHQTGVLRFGHWRVRAPSNQGMRLYPPFQTPLTLAAGGGSVLWSNINNTNESVSSDHEPNINPLSNLDNTEQSQQQRSRAYSTQQQETQGQQQKQQQSCPVQESSSSSLSGNKKSRMTEDVVPESQPNLCEHGTSCGIDELVDDYNDRGQDLADVHVDSCTQGRLLRLIRAIQMVEKAIIARHLKYLFPTLYEKYHGLQFGTPRLFDAVATVALAMDVSPRLHHDKAHTKHGFCWIVACGDFVGGDLCIPELGKRVVMRPGTVVAIRSTVVAYYVERYAKNTSMFTMYGYTSDNNWPPTA